MYALNLLMASHLLHTLCAVLLVCCQQKNEKAYCFLLCVPLS